MWLCCALLATALQLTPYLRQQLVVTFDSRFATSPSTHDAAAAAIQVSNRDVALPKQSLLQFVAQGPGVCLARVAALAEEFWHPLARLLLDTELRGLLALALRGVLRLQLELGSG